MDNDAQKLADDSETDAVVLTGKVVEIGDYPERGFSIRPEEMDEAIAAFHPIPNDLEHSRLRDVLGHSMGELRRLWRVGKEVFGEISISKWLADLTGNALKVSLSFNRAKRVVGNALTLSPRIADAEVVAAFSESRSLDPESAQKLHDLAVAHGAVCAPARLMALKRRAKSTLRQRGGSWCVVLQRPAQVRTGANWRW